ncbi:hypothetical protein I0606_000581 [Staphylococcus pseudintermedius]|nr:hypothetical protein [Staphylococcus pseudintermedius]
MRLSGITELKRVMKNMSRIGDDVAEIMAGHSSDAVGIAVDNAKEVMNKGYWTGNLAREISSEMTTKLSFMLISGAYYSGFLEYGTRYMAAEPFMQPTVKIIKNKLIDDFSELLSG